MTLLDIIYKILLFFIVFYGAIMISSLISKKIRERSSNKEKEQEKNKDKEIEK